MSAPPRWYAVLAIGAFVGLCLPSAARAQFPGGDRGGSGSSDFRQRMQEKMKEVVGATDEEWQVLQPRIERIQTLQRNISVGRAGMMMLMSAGSSKDSAGKDSGGKDGSSKDAGGSSGRDSGRSRSGFSRGGPGGAPGAAPGGAPTPSTPSAPAPVEEKAKDLQASLENKAADPKEVAAKLAALREERTKAKAELDRAQEDLRSLLTVRQESVLILVGVLDP